jgi:hypothetical protein
MHNDLHSPIFFCTFARSLWLNSLNFKGKNMNTGGKIVTSMVSVLLIGLGLFVFFKFFFVYSEGTNEGDINYFQREGFIFKTYEGKMIQTGYNSHNTSATIQSNEFKFSVVDERVAQQIDNNSSRQIKLHWKRYLGTLPWRGNSQFVVDSIISVRQVAPQVEDILQEMPLPVEN